MSDYSQVQNLMLARLSNEEANGGGGGGGATPIASNGNIFDVITGPGEGKTESLEEMARLHSASECKGFMEMGASHPSFPLLDVLFGKIQREGMLSKPIDFFAPFRQIRSGSIWTTKRQTFIGRGGDH